MGDLFSINEIQNQMISSQSIPWAMIIPMLIIIFILGIGIYIYFAICWQKIAKKLKHKKSWLAWIPIANESLILQLGGFNWAWIFLILVPILGWITLAVLTIIAQWRIFEKRKYPGALSLVMLGGFIPYIGILASIASMIILGFVAFKKR